MFDRFIKLAGEENFELIQRQNILVLGLGGVGGYVCEALVRSGIVNLTIVDYDKVDITNLNRQIIALHSTIGIKKTDVMKSRLEDINPDVRVLAIDRQIDESLNGLDLDKYDFIIDCIDDVPVKVALCKYVLKHSCKFIMATGTARKINPEKLKITSLDKTAYDPLAKRLRHLLKGYKINKIPVLSSDEVPKKEKSNVLCSSAFVPSSAGIMIASHVIRDIINK